MSNWPISWLNHSLIHLFIESNTHPHTLIWYINSIEQYKTRQDPLSVCVCHLVWIATCHTSTHKYKIAWFLPFHILCVSSLGRAIFFFYLCCISFSFCLLCAIFIQEYMLKKSLTSLWISYEQVNARTFTHTTGIGGVITHTCTNSQIRWCYYQFCEEVGC